MKKISVVSACYNEKDNVGELYRRLKAVLDGLKSYTYEIIFIDNNSQDRTVEVLRQLASGDKKLKIIINARNFGHLRSPYYGLLQADGDAVVYISSDLQEPPELIGEFIKKWEEGFKIIVGVKTKSRESRVMFGIRKLFYWLMNKLSENKQIENFTGFGLYDKKIIDIIRNIEDPYPYFRGLVSEIGYDIAPIEYTQNKRARGVSKNNFYTLFDLAMLGIVNNSKIPLRLAVFMGAVSSLMCFLIGLAYLIYKILFWNSFQLGIAPLVVGAFFFFSVQLIFIGILGEYIGAIYTQVKKRPLVIEKERVNF